MTGKLITKIKIELEDHQIENLVTLLDYAVFEVDSKGEVYKIISELDGEHVSLDYYQKLIKQLKKYIE